MTWEQRWQPLREEWVIVAAHRQDRPWSGLTVEATPRTVPDHDPQCPLCPGNPRISGIHNPDYRDVFVFDNDHPCVAPSAPKGSEVTSGILRNRPALGVSRVVCYSPLHNTTLAQLPATQIERLLRVWQEQYRELGDRPEVSHVLVFENKGEVVGVSNPHPHCQIYATNFVFKTIQVEADACRRHWNARGRALFEEILRAEQEDGRRILCERDSAIGFVPYFARYAYETYVAPKQSHASLADLAAAELRDLAGVLRDVLARLDNLWKLSMPYVMALHQAPTDGDDYSGFHFHIELHPPLRRPNLLKYLAGPEIGGGSFLSDTSPEQKAAELRQVSSIHFTQGEEAVEND
ncbi:MAG: galactose-1-phosphate uridylyltransferase [Rhodopirellula sp.]|nr:galactose-1-phosphate uridylyltransferase [Rhodopirellula sp.]